MSQASPTISRKKSFSSEKIIRQHLEFILEKSGFNTLEEKKKNIFSQQIRNQMILSLSTVAHQFLLPQEKEVFSQSLIHSKNPYQKLDSFLNTLPDIESKCENSLKNYTKQFLKALKTHLQ